jgi:hypothetical protein
MMSKDNLENEIDALFRLPLPEFTGARNALAARLKKSGRGEVGDAALVKALVKPSISAWAVNQLYWNHREAFAQLIKSGERFHKAQTSGKVADMRSAMDERRELLTTLSDLASSILEDAGHNPTPDTIRHITTTLEALSAYAQRSDGRHPQGAGRLTTDVDPPGFELFGSSMPSAGIKTQQAHGGRQVAETPSRVTSPRKFSSGTTTGRRVSADVEVDQLAEKRKAKLAAATVSLQDAKRLLTQVRATAQSLEATQKKVDVEAKKAEQRRRDAEVSFEKAKTASEAAAQRARNVAAEVEEAASALEDAELAVEKASKEYEKLSGE